MRRSQAPDRGLASRRWHRWRTLHVYLGDPTDVSEAHVLAHGGCLFRRIAKVRGDFPAVMSSKIPAGFFVDVVQRRAFDVSSYWRRRTPSGS
jgi:hypothetical protein